MMKNEIVASSFRDPSGFVFSSQGVIYRQVSQSYKAEFDRLMESGLYEQLVGAGLLIPHEEVSAIDSPSPDCLYKIIRPEAVKFISYPYEWSFSQLKDAALATIAVQKMALKHGMTLKDCSAYNIQYHQGRPVFIDTLSFEEYREGDPWTPYKQFCQHFLAPLALMSLVDVRLIRILQLYIDGIPLDLASSLLPYRSKFSFPLLLHIHAHAKSQTRYSDKPIEKKEFVRSVSRTALLGLLDSLESAVKKLSWKAAGTEWADYYNDDSYTPAGLDHKQELLKSYLRSLKPSVVWDMGANNGFHSRLAVEMGSNVVAFDVDPACVELNYIQMRKSKEINILPLLLDLTNPSPGIGWGNEERLTVPERGCADMVMALALIHHIAISNNVPLSRAAEYFSKMCRSLIIEFVPKSDHKVQRLLATREDVFPEYTPEGFETAFERFFEIVESNKINESDRVLYLMKRE
ncbi:MAG: SAM-dependent methyltransferase [Armatimonadota bacterium]|nr:SAM-dependent methyltransferase [bacterium]